MAFALRNLSVLAYAQGFTLWHYRAEDDGLAGMEGFFDPASDMIASGDMLLISSPQGGRMVAAISGAAGVCTAPLG